MKEKISLSFAVLALWLAITPARASVVVFDFSVASDQSVENTDTIIGVTESLITAIPEPSTWAMMLIGFAGLGFLAYRRQSKASI